MYILGNKLKVCCTTRVDIQMRIPETNSTQTGSCFSTLPHGLPGSSPMMQCDPAPVSPSGGKMENKMKEVKDCRVCGDGTTGTYFGATVCLPCKTFFIRYGTAGPRQLRCRNNNRCKITLTSRTRCKYCRLMKCYSVGMIRKERPEVMQAGEGQELCSVCHDIANGIHFGTYTCEGCKKFFRRGLKESTSYRCIKKGNCVINPRTRNSCRYCRYKKCLFVGMTPKVRVGRPRKAQRESLLSALQKIPHQNPAMRSLSESDSRSSITSTQGDSLSPPCGRHPEDIIPDLRRSESCSSLSSSETRSPLHFNFNQGELEGAPSPIRMMPTPEPTQNLMEAYPNPIETYYPQQYPYREHHQMEDNMREPRREAAEVVDRRRNQGPVDCLVGECQDYSARSKQKPCKVHVGDFTYLLSETLSKRYMQVILPYWSHPLLPHGDREYSPADRNQVAQITAAHANAISALCGSLPSHTILKEALSSKELTENVGDFLRQRLVRILNSFITFIKSQGVLMDIHEQNLLTMIRMNVNTWSLIGASCRFYSPETCTLHHVQDIPLHPDNPHTPLNARTLHMAHKLHNLHIDETEAALLSISCILATDAFDVQERDIIEKKRWHILELFRAYSTAKYGWPNWRLEELFAGVPEMRLTAIWFNELSHTTWFPPTSSSETQDTCPS